MKKEEVLRQLDQIVTTQKVHIAALEQTEGDLISFVKKDYIHVREGIAYLADAAGEPVSRGFYRGLQHPYNYSFEYKGITIVEVSEYELSLEVHWDE